MKRDMVGLAGLVHARWELHWVRRLKETVDEKGS